jgi:hypothetical protein
MLRCEAAGTSRDGVPARATPDGTQASVAAAHTGCRRGEQRSGSNLAVASPRTEERNLRHIASLPMLHRGLACPVVPCSAGLLLFAT